MCYQFFRKESTLFTTKTHFSNEFSLHYWQESFDGDSFVSQSRFDAYSSVSNRSGEAIKEGTEECSYRPIFNSRGCSCRLIFNKKRVLKEGGMHIGSFSIEKEC